MFDIAAFGELLIDFVALEQGVTVGEASGFVKAPGGAPANVAVAASRLGCRTAFLGQVGDDPFGYFLADTLRADNVDISGLCYSKTARTALAFVSNDAEGDRSFMFYRHPSADMLMMPEVVDLDVIDQTRILHHGSITLIDDPVRAATHRAIQHAHDIGATISYDPNLRLALWSSESAARAGLMGGLETAHIVKISDDEVDFLVRGDVDKLWREHTRFIVVTHGARGSTLYTRDGEQAHHDGFRVKSIDTTGAGDAFVAAMLTSLIEQERSGDSIDYGKMLAFANATGALTTLKKGAIPSLPDRTQVEAFLKESGE